MDKILIAGASGKIGSYLFNQLNQNYSVKALGRSLNFNTKDKFSVNLLIKEDVFSFVNNYEGCDVLIFLVGLAHKKGEKGDINEFRLFNKQTLVNLLSAFTKFKKTPKKIIFSSTISVYGQSLNDYNFKENDITSPHSPYAITKLEAENYLRKHFGDRSYILRLAPVYSNNFFLNINRRVNFYNINYRVGKGLTKISMCNMENIVSAVKGILDDKVPNDIYNISDTTTYSYRDLHSWSKNKFLVTVPEIIVKIIYFFGFMINNIFLKENMAKLISSNLYPSKKFQQYTKLPYNLNDCEYS